jgi:hypothetical protein
MLLDQNSKEIDFRSASRIKQLEKLAKKPKLLINDKDSDEDDFKNLSSGTISESSSSDE